MDLYDYQFKHRVFSNVSSLSEDARADLACELLFNPKTPKVVIEDVVCRCKLMTLSPRNHRKLARAFTHASLRYGESYRFSETKSRSLNLLFVHSGWMVGGVETVLKSTCEMLSEQGHSIVVFITQETDAPVDLPDGVRVVYGLNSYERDVLLESFKSGVVTEHVFEVRKELGSRLLQYASVFSADLVIDYKDAIVPWMDGVLSELKAPLISWGHEVRHVEHWSRSEYSEYVSRLSMAVCVSPSLCEMVREQIPSLNVISLFNPVRLDAPQVSSRENYFVYVGRLVDSHKNISGLLSVYRRYRDAGGSYGLKIVGDGPDRERLELLTCEGVVFLGEMEIPYSVMAQSQGLLLTSHYEGLPTVLIEAAYCETPTISYDCKTGPADIFKRLNLKDGLVPFGDEAGFVSMMFDVEREGGCAPPKELVRQRFWFDVFDDWGLALLSKVVV